MKSARSRFPLLPLLAASIVLVLLAIRQLLFVQQNAVDVLYWDSWDIYRPLFAGQGWWACFDLQQGPHRQGLGGLLIKAMAERSRWDCRWDAASVAVVLIMAAIMGLLLAWRCGVRGWALAGVPVIVLNIRQYQMLVASANPSPQAIPVLLLTFFGLACFVKRSVIRLTLLVMITFFSVFTGFGIFVGLVMLALSGIEMTRAIRARDRGALMQLSIAVAATIGVFVAFAIGYSLPNASVPLEWPPGGFVDYLKFIALLLANAVGLTHETAGVPDWLMFAIGAVLAVGGAIICAIRTQRLLRLGMAADPVSAVIVTLSAYGIIFSVNAAIGRTQVGWQLAASSRYVTLCIPILMAVLLQLATSTLARLRWAAVGYAVVLAAGTAALHGPELASVKWAHDGCLNWRAAYVVTHDFAAANGLAQFPIYPDPSIGDRLNYLEKNRLNLFDPDVFGTIPIN